MVVTRTRDQRSPEASNPPSGPDLAASRAMAKRPLSEVIDEPGEPVLRRTVWIVASFLKVVTRQDWRDMDKVPRTGGVVVVANHISNFDPVVLGHYLAWAGRWPRFLAKEGVFRAPVLGWVASHGGQIKVCREGPEAMAAVYAVAEAVAAGKAITVYPEGTITSDPQTWPMKGKTGVARIALTTGSPVIPIGQWGAHEVMPGRKVTWPRLLPPKTMRLVTGDPVDLDDLRDEPLTAAILTEATERIMSALTDLVAGLREESPPAGRWNPRLGRRAEPGPGRSGPGRAPGESDHG